MSGKVERLQQTQQTKVELTDVFGTDHYEFRMRFRQGAIGEFFGRTTQHDAIIAERRHRIATAPHRYALFLPSANPLLEEMISLLSDCGVLTSGDAQLWRSGNRNNTEALFFP